VKALVFDLDGTLADTREDLAEAANRLRQDYGLARLTVPEVLERVGGGAPLLVRRLLGDALTVDGLPKALEVFLGHYGEVWNHHTRAYPGAGEALEVLGQRFPLAILSNKTEGFSRRVLEHLGLLGFFAEILGGDSLPTKKPDPAGLLELARRFEVEVGELALVGDSRWDAETAFRAPCPFYFCTWGFAGEEESREIRRDPRVTGVVESLPELASRLGR
jgi:phosphoglycolate phosphatase